MQKEEVRRLFILEAAPFVRRTIFIATPHRGSYRAGGLVRAVTRRLVSIPSSLAGRLEEVRSLVAQLKLPKGVDRKKLTSIDGMSPNSPILRELSELPVAPHIKAHSIIPVDGDGDLTDGSDGVVKYKSAHLENVESEFIVRHKHSCQSTPAAIEEVRRILHLHIDAQYLSPGKPMVSGDKQLTEDSLK